MKKLILLIAGMLLPTLAAAQPNNLHPRVPLMYAYDLEGKAASDSETVALATIVDSTSYTIAASPDQPRPLVVTVADANSSITVGTVTIVCLDSNGATLTGTASLTGGSGTKTITWTGGTAPSPTGYCKTVSSVSNGVVTGEGGAADTIKVGTNSTIPTTYCAAYGPAGVGDVFNSWTGKSNVTTAGLASTTVTSVLTDDSFLNMDVNDEITFPISGSMEVRYISAKANNNSITVNAPVTIVAAGTRPSYRKIRCGSEANNGWVPIDNGVHDIVFAVDVDQMVVTGGITATFECRVKGADDNIEVVDTQTISAAGTESWGMAFAAWSSCRIGLKPATNDDADDLTTNKEIIKAQYSGSGGVS